jgi:hypothetical protein
VPAQYDLRGRTVLATRDFDNVGILQQAFALTERTPRLGENPIFLVEFAELFLRKLRV